MATKRLIDQLTDDQRYQILTEIVEDMNDQERDLLQNHFAPEIQAAQDAVDYMTASAYPNDEDMIRIAREIANKRNDPSTASGVRGRKLI